MSEVKYTPGPWLTEVNSYGDEIEVYPQKNGPLPIGRWAEICAVRDYESQEEMEANAALIAAAPDLLQALDAALTKLEVLWQELDAEHGLCRSVVDVKDSELWPQIVAARAAISKAEGRT